MKYMVVDTNEFENYTEMSKHANDYQNNELPIFTDRREAIFELKSMSEDPWKDDYGNLVLFDENDNPIVDGNEVHDDRNNY